MNNKSIQILRTKLDNTDPKVANEVLLDGQPFYNKKTKKFYIGDGESKLNQLSGVNIDLNIENGTGDVLIQTTDSNQSFKVMTDGRAKVYKEPEEPDDVVRKGDLTASASSSTGFAASFKSLKSYEVPSAVNDVLRWQEKLALETSINNEKTAREDAINALVGSGIQGTGDPPLQRYNKNNGTIEARLESAEQTTSMLNKSYYSGFYMSSSGGSNKIEIDISTIPKATSSTLFLAMIAIYDESNKRMLTCCMTIGNGGNSTGYFRVSYSASIDTQVVECTYSDSNKTYTLTGPSEKVGSNFKYALINASILRIN